MTADHASGASGQTADHASGQAGAAGRAGARAGSAFALRFDTEGPGIRLAVKDLIDMAGEVTTAGCRAVARTAAPATVDAACLAGSRRAGARIVGRTVLHELALGVTGINRWAGTPVNPLGPSLAPGGSSSGSAVAVATGEADVALGTDTGGSVRIPAACTGTAGLKTTWGRVPVDGVRPLAPTLDTVGPMAADVAGLVTGMALLEPGFVPAAAAPAVVGRLRVPAAPAVDEAVDRALAATGWQVVDVALPEWDEVGDACAVLLVAEAWRANEGLVRDHPRLIGPDVRARLHAGSRVDADQLASVGAVRRRWRQRVASLFGTVPLLATPTLGILPPTLADAGQLLSPRARCTLPASLAGVPALSLPVPAGPLPASLQLVAPHGGEELLLAAGAVVEAAVRAD